MYHPSIAYQVYRLERGLTPSEQREADRRTGEMAAAIEHAYKSLARALGWPKANRARASDFPACRSLKTSEVR